MLTIAFAAEPVDMPVPTAILFTSRNAVRAVARWQTASAWRRVTVYAVGAATAALAREAGFADVRIGDGDAAALSDLVRADFDTPAGPMLYPAARERSADMAAMLPGFDVVTVEAYHGTAATRLDEAFRVAIASSAAEGALFFSRRTAAIFADLVVVAGIAGGLKRTRFFALSDAAAEPLARLRPAEILVAPRPDEDSMIELIGH
jgi:uroporphyrinogen-III synthase